MHTTLTARSLTAVAAAAVAATLLLSGCSSTGKSATASSSPVGATTAASAPATSSATAGAGASTGASTPGGTTPVVVRNADKGKTITLHTGQTLEVVLSGGYWPAPASSAAGVLKAAGAPSFLSASPGRGCPPGVGCRPEQTDFTAVAPGTATVSATRTNCGEAMRCTDANGKFTISVTVVS
ncbi:hypothetical protein ABH931_007852 [Streptacidiphilus sp. MAP12-33]|uniref:hypothetical protein n=1 Tax=Streptacidiphilus sp. MAP12-33 TaxID=3156266 RepID=UPI0035121155